MDRAHVAGLLPESPGKDLMKWARKTQWEELGGDYITFKSVRVAVDQPLGYIMEHNSLKPRKEWAAECSCTACGETFYTQKVTGRDAIQICTGEDGMAYPIEPGGYIDGGFYEGAIVETAVDGEKLSCPICQASARLIHEKRLRGGRTKRIMVEQLVTVAGYAGVIYWMICRQLDEFGVDTLWADPADAYILTERGGLARFCHIERTFAGAYRNCTRWYPSQGCPDKLDVPYQDWGSINNRKCGADIHPVIPDLTGTTGEKTGLEAFVADGGWHIVTYLKFWRTHRNIENLCKAGQAKLISDILRRSYSNGYSLGSEMNQYIYLKERKPHRMLGITKPELRQLQRDGIKLDLDNLRAWKRYKDLDGALGMAEFMALLTCFGQYATKSAFDIMGAEPGVDLDKIFRYLVKQDMEAREVRYLVDTRNMARQLNPGRELTQEELWPRRLRYTHDRLTAEIHRRKQLESAEKAKIWQEQFLALANRYKGLEWTDGDLCIRLPRCDADLAREGEVLHHCVGGYTKSHLEGRDTIFFVRRYRKPERCYYTLDIRMTGKDPEEIQLHGYGNEHHGSHMQYRHSIPPKVRQFVDRWKKEVMMPWWAQQKKQEEKTA